MGFIDGIKQFNRGMAVILGRRKLEGNQKVAVMARMVDGMIPEYGVDNVRKQVISSIEKDMLKVAKKLNKNGSLTPDAIMKSDVVREALNTPDYMTMLRHLSMDDSHLWALAHGVVKEVKKNGNKRR